MSAALDFDHSKWYEAPGVLARFLGDAIAAELRHLRPGGATLQPFPWSPELSMGEDGLGLDSIERLSIATSLSELIQLDKSGRDEALLNQRDFGEWLDVAASGLKEYSAQLVFRTSGSTGKPKRCAHALADLEREAEHLATILAGTRRVLAAVPAHHIYGFLFTVLLPFELSGIEVIDVRHVTPSALPRMMAPGDVLVSHPAHLALVARFTDSLPRGVSALTSTAPCPAELAQALTAEGAFDRVLEIYGSSETAGVGVREAPASDFQLMPFWTRDAADATRLVHRAHDRGERSVTLQDHLQWITEDSFIVSGRRDNAVQVAGTNVFPARVREALLQHPHVDDAAVRLMDPSEGARLKAFVVPSAGVDVERLAIDLQRWTVARLSAPERPKSFTFGARLPLSDCGKDSNWCV
ncbi:AMP-binding protein [Caballeronia sp. LZ062]|uniref:AMP-binding protein n=1 Tax=unclassified Caballeronia TaxID=2646786 RepID=UPI00285D3C80|nr:MULTISPECIES: AMP-binding protein [unclassified Caballeronia]MDR5857785.1 AMP-binding protein [Caballeronia sp. LZ050]MDR5869335.1 AMP-binding protein [Caballeronia sp. LZ062]